LDVHKDTIAVAVCEQDGTACSLGTIPNEPEAVARLMRKLGSPQQLYVCYEAGPCGYVLYWQLSRLGIRCDVVAPSLIPVRAGERVKTDRKDALKLARALRNGDLVAVFVPDAAHLALRELVRTREDALIDQRRARTRLKLMLLRWGLKPDQKLGSWSAAYMTWVQSLRRDQAGEQYVLQDALAQVGHHSERLKHLEAALIAAVEQAPPELRQVVAALQCLVGVKVLTATTVAVETGGMGRFDKAPQLFSYAGLVPSEHSSGGRKGERRGRITKTGNAHLRRVLVEAAWAYSKPLRSSGPVTQRRRGQPDPIVIQIATKAQQRLRTRYLRLTNKGLPTNQAITAVARELLGFMWAMVKRVEQTKAPPAETAKKEAA
jgi:transposase